MIKMKNLTFIMIVGSFFLSIHSMLDTVHIAATVTMPEFKTKIMDLKTQLVKTYLSMSDGVNKIQSQLNTVHRKRQEIEGISSRINSILNMLANVGGLGGLKPTLEMLKNGPLKEFIDILEPLKSDFNAIAKQLKPSTDENAVYKKLDEAIGDIDFVMQRFQELDSLLGQLKS